CSWRVADADDQRTGVRRAKAIQRARSWRRKIARLRPDGPHTRRDQLGLDEEIGVGRIDVQPLNGEHVGADLEQRSERRDIEILELNRHLVRTPPGGGRVPGWRVGRIPARDLLPVEPGNKTVVVLEAEGELSDVRWIRNFKRNSDEGSA